MSVHLIGGFNIDMIETSSSSHCNVENLVCGFDDEMQAVLAMFFAAPGLNVFFAPD